MVKALLYALGEGKISFGKGMSTSENYSFRFVRDGIREQIKSPEGQIVQEKNIAKLMAWIRNEEELIAEWSAAFDASIERQCAELPILNGDNEMSALEARVTGSQFIKQLTGGAIGSKDGLFALKNADEKLSIIDFAYKIKNNEESGLDCDDAERIIEVAYETFMKFMTYRTPMKAYPERFIQLYKQQSKNFYEGIANSAIKVCKNNLSNKEAKNTVINAFDAMLFWLNYADTFRGIGEDKEAMNEAGDILINENVGIKHDLCDKARAKIDSVVKEAKAKEDDK